MIPYTSAILVGLRFATHDDGTLVLLGGWWPDVRFTEEFLAAADGRRLEIRGDEVQIHCTNADATYTLGPRGAADGSRAGHLVRSRSC